MFRRIALSSLVIATTAAAVSLPPATLAAGPPTSLSAPDDGDRHVFPGGVFTTNGVEYAPDRILVRFRPDATTGQRNATRGLLNATEHRELDLVPGLEKVKLPRGTDPIAAAASLARRPDVEYATPDFAYKLDGLPTDPGYVEQWGLAKIGAPNAWDRTTGSRSVIVAVIDSGVDLDHPDLKANLVPGWNFVDGTDDPSDDLGHGTHVAGIIGAVGNDGLGVAGVNWNVSLMPLKICDSQSRCWLSAEIEALAFAIEHGASVANASFGGFYGGWEPERDAIAEAGRRGLLYVAAAGNNEANTDLETFYPAGYPLDNIISVGASQPSDQLAEFSNYGRSSVDLVAPGANIFSTYPDDDYAFLNGTSMAAPFVSGAAALVRSLHPDWGVGKVRKRIIATTSPVSGLEGKIGSCGRLNLAAATSSAAIKPTLCVQIGGSGVGSVSSAPAGISCGAACIKAFKADALVTLTPSPAPGATFAGWGGACSGTDPCTVKMSVARFVTARFRGATTQGGWKSSRIPAPPGRDPMPPNSRTGFAVGSFFNVAQSADGRVRAKTVYNQPQYCYYDSSDTGGIYIERRTSSGWVADGAITAPRVGSDEGARWTACNSFGETTQLSADGSTLLVTQGMSPVWAGEERDEVTWRCVAFVYRRDAVSWKLDAKLFPKNIGATGQAGVEGCGYFGQQGVISADGNRVAILGTKSFDYGAWSPRADVFVRGATGWARERSLVAPQCGGSIGFRWLAMSSDGSTVLLSNPECNVVHAFDRSDTGWVLAQSIRPPSSDDNSFGYAIAISADGLTATIGSSYQPGYPDNDGAAWVYERAAGVWQSRIRLTTGIPMSRASWGYFDCRAIVRGGSRIICSAYDKVGLNEAQGSLYVFNRPTAGWAAGSAPTRLYAVDGFAFDRLSATGQMWLPIIAAREDGTVIDVPISPYNLATGAYPHDRIGYEFRK